MSGHGHGLWRTLGREEEKQERKVPDRVLLTRLAKYVLKYKWRFIIGVIAVLVASLTALLPPYLIQVAIDNYMTPPGDFTRLAFISVIVMGVYVVNWVSDYTRTYQISWIGQNMVNEMRKQLFSHLQDLSFNFYDHSEAGRLVSRITNDTDTLSQMFVEGVITLVSDIITLFGVVAIMLWMSVRLTLATLLVVLPLLLLTWLFQSRLRRAYQATRKKIAVVTSRLEESVSGIREIQSFVKETDTMETFRRANIENLQANVQAGRLFALLIPMVQILAAVGTCLVLWFGGMLTISEEITLGVIVAFLLYERNFFRPIIDLTMFYNTVQSSMAAAERIFETLDTKPEIVDAPSAVELANVQGEIVFDHVTFGYDSSNHVLRNVSIHVKPKETLAIVGPTGAGKSTIVKLLSRFYETQKGTITVDGHNIRKVTIESLHKQMGVVLQESFLFSGTIMENIRYGKLDASDDEITKIAKMVGLHEFVESLPEGYQTDVGERGARVSVGQRQLISFARALLRDPKILILDEATSSIDPYTELKIKKGLATLLKDRTSLVIAHRLSTVRNADHTIVLNEGKIVEEGTHAELMKRKGLYRRLYEKQFRDT